VLITKYHSPQSNILLINYILNFTNIDFNSEEILKFYSELKKVKKKPAKKIIHTGFFIEN